MTSKFSSPLLAIALAASAAATLSACVPLVVGGAAMSAMVAVDRRTSGAPLEDEGIELRAASRLRDTFGDRAHISVTSYNRQVLLTGEVASAAAKQQAEQVVSRVENVRSIVNELAPTGVSSTLVERSNDVLITGKVKASLVDAKDLYAGAFKVVTERGVVYLMGRVTPREADRATSIARQISGVQRVVRIFEVIGDDELRRIQTQAAPTTPTSGKP
jgi:osmotically-inducible protein OsmY